MPVHDLTPDDVAQALAEDRILLVDVREPHEVAMARIPEAVNLPLSQFDPAAIPDPQGKMVVFLCAAGVRSIHASEAAQAAGLPYDSHMAGGLKAWAMAGHGFERG
ncbi:rhodanese-like domain-containing protein [Phreatobacter oligotrophus]|jgi:rhodanese-related sulfurtransferase|uniref:Rhodanese-related sulfurtransferase n=1 Tax=Phreatobacter oligotrophus TaxID=1122261 RepID=A0A2T4ZI37_9HYPH|nr:rhodanese-like domain-containing protein [Phreatobacter oligotrophus]PTM61650.1 rhodanese-related sulfurtransferase [Phreatobacter oligotrophus]